MRQHLNETIAIIMLTLFVNFVFSNSVFMHSHTDALGNVITHSHPYIPASGHQHSQISLDQIAGFNTAASSVIVTLNVPIGALTISNYAFVAWETSKQSKCLLTTNGLRAPPYWRLIAG